MFGKQKPPSSLDFGEGFYCTYDTKVCREQAFKRAQTKCTGLRHLRAKTLLIDIDQAINQDTSLKCVYFDGKLGTDGLDWAEFIAYHRYYKDKRKCNHSVCNGHPDIMIGPVADGNAITSYAEDVLNGKITLLDFYKEISQAQWFPNYRQIVFGEAAIKYLAPVL